jgi:GH15 family glucan-1,4-alpha-glucosidase
MGGHSRRRALFNRDVKSAQNPRPGEGGRRGKLVVNEGPYRPIRDYAAIGDCHGCALIGRDGSVDWCALRRFDGDPVFCRVLDADRGGFLSIRPADERQVERDYIEGTNILRTVFSAPGGRVAVTDFMPVGRRLDCSMHDYVNLNAPGWLVRRIEVLEGEVELRIRYRPSGDFAARPVELCTSDGAVRGAGVPSLFSELEFGLEGDLAAAEVTLRAGERRDLVLALNTIEGQSPLARVDEFLAATRAFWLEWIAYCRYRGPHAHAVRRSALALKLLTYAPSGALVAALTTSLPEEPGGERNWDYRFSWLRDSCFTLYALSVLGYSGEGRRYTAYLADCVRQTLPRIQIMYGIEREHALDECTLDHLEGYMASRPVRTGNGAYTQRQIDVYGQALDLALLFQALGGRIDEQYRRLLRTFADFVVAHWQEPDQGLWEMRGPPRHHVHGKLMSWAALDRASRLFEDGGRYGELAERVAAEIKASAIDPAGGHLRQSFDGGVDAAVLLAPMLGFPAQRGTIERTIDTVERTLGRGDYVLRYLGEDGLPGEEGAFLICSFWLVDAKLSVGRVDEARALFERLVACANDVGLFAEEIEPGSGAFLGNFPQAFTHLALIGSACNLSLVERHGPKVLFGTYADRARRAVEATFGWRGVWAAIKQSRRLGRLRSSPRSKLAWP